MHSRASIPVMIFTLSLVACSSAPIPIPSTGPAQTAAPSLIASPVKASDDPGLPAPTRSAAPIPGWQDAGELNEARNATNVVVVGTGEVLVVGSDYQTSWQSACGAATNGSDSVEIGDPGTRIWDFAASLSSPREDPTVVALRDGRALMTGGERGENYEPAAFSSTYLLDPTTREWSRSGLLNTARSGAAGVVLLDGRVLVAGGMFLDGPMVPRILDSAEVWDPGSGTWSVTGGLAVPRWGASAVTLADGRVLIVGGVARQEDAPAEEPSTEIYDPASARWSSAGALGSARPGSVLVALSDGGAIVAGGFGGLGTGSATSLRTVERFDPVSNTWSAAADLPFPVSGAAAIRLQDGLVLVAGGVAHEPTLIDVDAGTFKSGFTADAALFEPESNTWTVIAPLPSPRAGASAVLLPDGSAVFAGGSSSEGSPFDTPGCPEADPQVLLYVPGA